MKGQRILYLMGVVSFSFLVIGVLCFWIFPGAISLSKDAPVSVDAYSEPDKIGLNNVWLETISAKLGDVEYAISGRAEAKGELIAYQAPNRAQNLRTYFSETGIQVEPRLVQGNGWQVGFEILVLTNGVQTLVPEFAAYTTDSNQVTMDYGQWQAWYVNDVRGVEQGFMIEEPLFAQDTDSLQIDMVVTGDLKPQFVSDDELRLVTAVGEHMLTYQNLVAFDAQGTELSADMEVVELAEGQNGIRLAVDVAGAEYPIVIDPILSREAHWEAWIDDQPDTNFGFSVSTAGDVNLDGYDDVLVGAPWFDGGAPDTGAVFGYYGGPDGLSPIFQWMVEGDELGMEFGYAVNTAGDVNNDDIDDVIIGTHMTPTGKAFVFLGSPAGLNQQPVWIGMGEQVDDGFGLAVNTAGDVNGDTYDDIIIGAPYFDINGHSSLDGGRVYVFSGEDVKLGLSDLALSWRAENDAELAASGFGYSVGTAGDVDNNGFDDVIIGAPFYDPDGETGYAGIFSGTVEGLPGGWGGGVTNTVAADWNSLAWSYTGANYGFSVGTAGDVNQDGFADVVVGAPLLSNIGVNEGAVFVFTGTNSINNMETDVDINSPWSWSIGGDNWLFGYSVGTAGDVDNDGYDDVIVGAPQFDNGAMQPGSINAENGGGAFLLPGTQSGFGNGWEVSSNELEAKFGTSVGTAGDVNGDGYADIIIGAPLMPNPSSGFGEAFSFFGSGVISNFQAFNDSPTVYSDTTKLWADMDAGGVLDYEWDLGDGSGAHSEVVEHVYPQPGYYTAIVTGTNYTDWMTATTAVTISENSLISPNGGSLSFINEETGFGTGVVVPPGAVSNTVQLSYTPLTTITQPSPKNSLGYYFDLDVDDLEALYIPMFLVIGANGTNQLEETAVANAVAGVQSADSYVFATPITVTIVYSDTGLTEAEELSLILPYWNKEQQKWIDIAAECDLEDTYVYYPEENYFTVQVCHLSRFSVIH